VPSEVEMRAKLSDDLKRLKAMQHQSGACGM
jgi:hypothetical protein